MDFLALVAGLLVPWWLGVSALALLPARARPLGSDGELAWLAGAGYLAGAFLLTVWMRVLSAAGVKFGVVAVALPLVVAAIACTVLAWRREPAAWRGALRDLPRAFAPPAALAPGILVLWWGLVGWLVLRFALLGVELTSRPLYPWDAWTQWATKARVWYELGYLAPFARTAAWLAADGAVYFDASPEYPPTMPLLQVWHCLVLGRWDDALMNGPWWMIAVALALVVFGGLRSLGAAAPAALVGTFLVASLPLANVHVALAGYADLPMAAFYTAAALAFLRWTASRAATDAALTLLLAAACTQIKNPGWFWAATLVPGAIVALSPRYGVRIALAGFAAAGVAVVALARFKLTLFNYQINVDFNPAWGDLAQSYFLLGNWHILWYAAIAVALLAWRQLLAPALAPLSIVLAGGLLFLFFVFGFTTASYWVSDQTTVNRASLHLAPMVAVFVVLGWQTFAQRWAATHPAPAEASTAAASDAA